MPTKSSAIAKNNLFIIKEFRILIKVNQILEFSQKHDLQTISVSCPRTCIFHFIGIDRVDIVNLEFQVKDSAI